VLDILQNFGPCTFLLNEEAFSYINIFRLPIPVVRQLKTFPQQEQIEEKEFLDLLDKHLPYFEARQRKRVLEAAAVAAYDNDAPQFKLVTQELALCWVHDGRHYKKHDPFVPLHQQLLDSFLKQYWDFYRQLLQYQRNPSNPEHIRLEQLFDEIFSTVTGYDALDRHIEKTRAKKPPMLIVLDHPEIPLHNNPAELGAQKHVISFGTRTLDSTKTWNIFMSISATAKKLGINFYLYVSDRISGGFEMPSMAELITRKSRQLNLGASWNPPEKQTVFVINLSIKDPFEAFYLYDDRSLMENNPFREVKQNWHFEHPPQKSKEGVWVQVYTVMAMKALTTAFLKWQEEQLKQEAKGKETTWLMYRRKLKVLNRNKLIVFMGQHYGIFPSHEVFMLADVPVYDITKELNVTREQIHTIYTNTIEDD